MHEVTYLRPKTVEHAVRLYRTTPGCRPLAGGMLGAWVAIHSWAMAVGSSWLHAIAGVLAFLWMINLLLVAFNMIPAYPMDGGRVLRSVLWAWKKNIRWATGIASRLGAGFGVFLMLLGVVEILRGGPMNGKMI